MRLIDAEDLKEGIACHKQYTDQKYKSDRQWAIGYNAGIDRALFSICYARTIEAAPVQHGEWKEHGNFIQCSQCGEDYAKYDWHGSVVSYYYCPNCGAQMHEKAP